MGDSRDGTQSRSTLMRVVAGTARGRLLVAPPGSGTRPTTDRVREAVFNSLHSLGVLDGAQVLDCFAGSGALGIEALSRGAAHVTFADTDAAARRAITDNLAAIDADDRADLSALAAERLVAEAAAAPRRFDVVLLDPPYGFEGWPALLQAVSDVLSDDAVVVMESDRIVELPDGARLEVTRSRRYGSTVVTFARPPGVDS